MGVLNRDGLFYFQPKDAVNDVGFQSEYGEAR